MRRLPPLSALRAFEAAARHGSFKRAANELAVTPTAISHQIRFLEEYTGLALFERQVRKVVLTDAGVELYPVLRDGFNAVEAVLQRLGSAQPRRRVIISATNAFMARWLAPRVADFRKLYPEIDLELNASDQAVDLGSDVADVAIRYGRGPYPGMVAEPLFADRFAPVSSPRLGTLGTADLDRVPLIDFKWTQEHPLNPTWKNWFAAAGLPWQARHGRLLFSDEGHAIQAVLAGQGIALLSLELVADDIAAGRLTQPFGPSIPGHTYHLVRSAGHIHGPHVDAALAWLRGQTRGPAKP
ncbi:MULTISPECIES: LysR substrate-binding domain-containing protein [unclassified Janthinobacterium]|uniref:LysR substrate-binding domain-containing protein n=1 Tax=unclassified Janthinobacterium TaxID=2610881 RepID=UPI00034BB8B5|nr:MULTISPECIES: LysR substrate-binding domain-containing protein [unclassified Janthinobacterium]MEC5162865.1 LysR family glycine cleavage system transcriptional activator [Janthinobacterium sp. CG_S6]